MTDVFISYSTRCPVYADMIEEDLEHDGYSCWRDRNKLHGGEKWKRRIQDAIQQSTIIVVLVTKYTLNSQWIKYELDFAAGLNKPCIPLIMEGLKKTGESLQKLGVDEDHAINFVEDHRRVAYSKLLACVKQYTTEWLPLANSIHNLNHFSSRVRQKAVDDLADSKDPRVIPYLQEAFDVEDIRALAMHILDRLGDFDDRRVVKEAIKIFEQYSEIGDSTDFVDVAKLILQRWGPHYPEINNLLLSFIDDNNVMIYACFALRNFAASVQEQAINKLVPMILSKESTANHVTALAQLGKRGVEKLKEIVEHPDFKDPLKEHARNQIRWNSGT